jgi:hypothetical protein
MNAPLATLPRSITPSMLRLRAFVIYARERARGLGMAGLAGALACVVALALLCFGYLPQQAAVVELQAKLAEQIAHPLPKAVAELGKGDLGHLPKRGDLPDIVGVIFKQAQGAGIVLERGTYAYAPLRAGRATRYQLEFPIKAAYPQLRKFLDLTLAALPAAGIDTLSIERKAIGEPLVDALVSFVVVARSAP